MVCLLIIDGEWIDHEEFTGPIIMVISIFGSAFLVVLIPHTTRDRRHITT